MFFGLTTRFWPTIVGQVDVVVVVVVFVVVVVGLVVVYEVFQRCSPTPVGFYCR